MKLDYKRGDVVEIGLAYQGAGHYAPDGNEGIYTVLKPLTGGPDFYLAKGELTDLEDARWDLISHASRMTLKV